MNSGLKLLVVRAGLLLPWAFAPNAAATSANCFVVNAGAAYCDLAVSAGKYADFTVDGDAYATANGGGTMYLNMALGGAPCNRHYGVPYSVDNGTRLSGVNFGDNFQCKRRLFDGQSARVTLDAPNSAATATYTRGAASFTEGDIGALPKGATANCFQDTPGTAHCDLVTTVAVEYADFTVNGEAAATGDGSNSGSMRLAMSTPAGNCNPHALVSYRVDNATVLSGDLFRCVVRVMGGQEITVTLFAPNDRADATYTRATTTIKLHPRNEVVIRTPDGNAPSSSSVSDASGRYVVFQSTASNLPNSADGNGSVSDIFRKDTETGVVLRLSSNNNGAPLAAAAIEPSVSADGNLVVFVAADAGISNVQNEPSVKTLARGKAAANTYSVLLRNLITNTTQRMAIPAQIGGAGTAPQISPDGNALVYAAPDPNTPGQSAVIQVPMIRQPNGSLVIGLSRCLSCKAINSDGSDSGDNAVGSSRDPALSEDGRYIVWETTAKNLLAGVPSPCPNASTEVVLRDLISGISQRMSAPPAPSQCGPAGSGAKNPRIDWKGRRVVFESDQPLKPGGGDANGVSDIYLRDLRQSTLTRVSETASGGDAAVGSSESAISGDGEVVSYVSDADNLDAATAGNDKASYDPKINLHVRKFNLPGSPTMRLSKTRTGDEANRESHRPALNYNGTQVAFDSAADNLTPATQANTQNVFQRANPLNAQTVFNAGFE